MNKVGLMANNFEFGERGDGWILRLRRNTNDWEFEELARLLACLKGLFPSWGEGDNWGWSLNNKDSFTTKIFYYDLIN